MCPGPVRGGASTRANVCCITICNSLDSIESIGIRGGVVACKYEAPTYALRNGRTWLTLFPVPHSHHGHSDASRPLLNFRSAAVAGYRPEYVPPRMPAPIARCSRMACGCSEQLPPRAPALEGFLRKLKSKTYVKASVLCVRGADHLVCVCVCVLCAAVLSAAGTSGTS